MLFAEKASQVIYIEHLNCSWQAWTEAPSIPSALVSMLLRLPKIKFVIVTLGEDGCVMLERSTEGECTLSFAM